MYVFIFLIKVTEWPPIGKIAAHSAYDMLANSDDEVIIQLGSFVYECFEIHGK